MTDAASLSGGLRQPRLLLLMLTHIVGTVGYMSVMAMAPVIRTDMGLDAADFGFFMSAFFGAQIVASLPSGAVADRLGVGWTLALSMIAMALGTVLFVRAGTFAPGVAAMFLMGLGYSLVNPATAKGVLDWIPRHRRGTAMGLKQLGVPVGGVLAAGAGALVVLVSWESILWNVVAAGLVTAALCLRVAERVNFRGNGRSMWGDLRQVMANRNLGVVGASVVGFNMGQSSLFAYLTLFVRDAALASQPVAGLCMALAQGASASGRVGFSYLSDTLYAGARKPVIAALLVLAVVSMILASWVSPGWNTLALACLALFMGGTIASYAALVVSATVEAAEPELAGSAVGYNSLAWSLGGTIGPPVFGWMLDTNGSYGPAWLTMAAIVGAGLLLFAFAFREQKPVHGP
jgi:ACS family hexuronate transporter-like MFS transporter